MRASGRGRDRPDLRPQPPPLHSFTLFVSAEERTQGGSREKRDARGGTGSGTRQSWRERRGYCECVEYPRGHQFLYTSHFLRLNYEMRKGGKRLKEQKKGDFEEARRAGPRTLSQFSRRVSQRPSEFFLSCAHGIPRGWLMDTPPFSVPCGLFLASVFRSRCERAQRTRECARAYFASHTNRTNTYTHTHTHITHAHNIKYRRRVSRAFPPNRR